MPEFDNTTADKPRFDTGAVSASDKAEASSAQSRINIALNLDNWKSLPEDVRAELLWFHQHALDARLNWDDCSAALNYDTSTVFRVLKGTYAGSWENICAAIKSYRKIVAERGTIQRQEFSPNRISKLVFGALSYALANNSVTLITGESRMGKSVAAGAWRDENNHGRTVLVVAPAYGGAKALLRIIAQAVGVSRNLHVTQMHESILRAFNRNRILIVDEAHRLLPGDRRSNPVGLEILRDIHDRTGAALALIATARFDTELRKGEYMFEQLIGRIGMPVRLPRKITRTDIEPILTQFIRQPSEETYTTALQVANDQGRLGVLVETLKVGSRIANKAGGKMTNEHFLKALAWRRQMMGETTFAEK